MPCRALHTPAWPPPQGWGQQPKAQLMLVRKTHTPSCTPRYFLPATLVAVQALRHPTPPQSTPSHRTTANHTRLWRGFIRRWRTHTRKHGGEGHVHQPVHMGKQIEHTHAHARAGRHFPTEHAGTVYSQQSPATHRYAQAHTYARTHAHTRTHSARVQTHTHPHAGTRTTARCAGGRCAGGCRSGLCCRAYACSSWRAKPSRIRHRCMESSITKPHGPMKDMPD